LRRVAEFRKEHEKLVRGLLPEHEKKAFLDGNIANILKDKDHLGRRVMIMNQGKIWNPEAVNIDQIFRVLYISEYSEND
jgi:retinaldehyde-binding protein 1